LEESLNPHIASYTLSSTPPGQNYSASINGYQSPGNHHTKYSFGFVEIAPFPYSANYFFKVNDHKATAMKTQ
jgi:hypothetical protein